MNPVAMDTTWVVTLAMVVARCGGMLVVAPVFGDAAVPVRLRVAMGIVMGLAAAGCLAAPAAGIPGNGLELVAVLAIEAGIGAVLGYLARLVFVGVELGAMHVGQQMGVALGEVFQPFHEGASGPVGRLMQVTAVVVFLAIGGHRTLIAALLGTFQALPPGLGGLKSAGGMLSCRAMLEAATAMLAVGFALALKLAAPVLAALLMTAAAGGLLQKTLPQLNILTVGLPVRALVGMVVLAASLAVLTPVMAEGVDALARQWAAALGPVQ